MNNPHEQQAAAMARAGELPDGEQLRSGNRCGTCKCADWCGAYGCWTLRECINSGQVSAAQVVAHAEAGELRLQGSPFESKMAMALHASFFDGWGACRDAEFVGDEAANDAFNQSATLGLCLSIDQNPVVNHAAALAAERAEVVRLREALLAWKSEAEHQYGLLRLQRYPSEKDYPVEGALDAYARGKYPALAALNQKATS